MGSPRQFLWPKTWTVDCITPVHLSSEVGGLLLVYELMMALVLTVIHECAIPHMLVYPSLTLCHSCGHSKSCTWAYYSLTNNFYSVQLVQCCIITIHSFVEVWSFKITTTWYWTSEVMWSSIFKLLFYMVYDSIFCFTLNHVGCGAVSLDRLYRYQKQVINRAATVLQRVLHQLHLPCHCMLSRWLSFTGIVRSISRLQCKPKTKWPIKNFSIR